MVNPGHRSKGCQQCRLSKVKCDEQRPACGRCTRTGRACPGYDSAEPNFRSMNTKSEATVQRRVQEKHCARVASLKKLSFLNGPSRRSSSIPFQLPPDWTDQCVSFFIAEYAERPDHLNSTWGHLEYVADMYSKTSATHLLEAVKAASYAYFANKSSIPYFDQKAKRSYGKALLDLGTAMHDPSRALDDETLAAMNVLATYEVIAGEQPLSETFHAHHQGQSAILRMRVAAQNSSRWAKNLLAVTNRGLIWRDMASLSRPTLGLTDWPPATYPSALAEASARFSVRAADIRGRVELALSTAPLHRCEDWRTEVQAVACDALKTDQDIQKCPDLVPEEWRPWRLSSHFSTAKSARQTPETAGTHKSEERSTQYPSHIDVYPTHNVAALWNFVGIARLHVLRAMLLLTEIEDFTIIMSGPECIPPPDILRDDMQSTIENISATVPFLLGDVDNFGELCMIDHGPSPASAIGLILVLLKISNVHGLELASGLRSWICKILERLGRTAGLKVGLQLSRQSDAQSRSAAMDDQRILKEPTQIAQCWKGFG